MKKKLFIVFSLVGFSIFLFGVYQFVKFNKDVGEFANPLSKEKKQEEKKDELPKQDLKVSKDKMFHVLLLGIDRRHKSETSFRTDVMILVSVNQSKKKVTFTSVPRDLWVNHGRINAVFVGDGWEGMQNAFEAITGFKPEAYIQCDFEDLVWIVDSMGGVEVDLGNNFTDAQYPNDSTKTYMTVSYPSGKQLIDGENALILSRSRHGNNGEGSDFKRMQRQHKILKALPEAILAPKSLFNPFNLKKFYDMVTSHMVTNLSVDDVQVLWDYYPHRSEYTVESFYVNSDFLINPPMSEYGGAWVLIPKNNDYTPIHTALKEKLGLIEPTKSETPEAPK